MFDKIEEPIIYVGTISDYADIIEKYSNGEYSYEEYIQQFNSRAKCLKQKEKKNLL